MAYNNHKNNNCNSIFDNKNNNIFFNNEDNSNAIVYNNYSMVYSNNIISNLRSKYPSFENERK